MKHLKTISEYPKAQVIADAKDVFIYIDSDFKNWHTDKTMETKNGNTLYVYEQTEDATFAQIFTEPEKMWLSQEQIIEFCRNHKNDLSPSWYTFFLFKVDSKFFVAYVDVYPGGLYVRVYEFSYDDVWLAEFGNRFVLPQLISKPLDSDPLKLCHCDTLKKRVKALEDMIEKIKSAFN